MRLCACLDAPLHIIEPTAFPWKEREFRRTGMDYMEHVDLAKHTSWSAFRSAMAGRRIVLVETDGEESLWNFHFKNGDVLMMGRESAGVPPEVRAQCATVIRIPMKAGVRSMNVVTAAAVALGEATRQIAI